MKNILNKSLIATAFLTIAWLPLSAAAETDIARGEHGGSVGGRGNFDGGEHIQQHPNNYHQQYHPYQQQHRSNEQHWNNEERRNWNKAGQADWEYHEDRRIENQLQNDYAPVVPVPYVDDDDSSTQSPDDSSSQQNSNSGQQNSNSTQQNSNSNQQDDDSNFDNQIWDFNK